MVVDREIWNGYAAAFLSNCEDAVLIVYLAKEEEDIYIGVLVLVCHLATHLPPGTSPAEPFSLSRPSRRKTVLVPPFDSFRVPCTTPKLQ
jgi:hypothetical protein